MGVLTVDMAECFFYQRGHLAPCTGSDITDQTCVNIILSSLTNESLARTYKKLLRDKVILGVCWRLGILTGSLLPHGKESLYEHILREASAYALSTNDYREFYQSICHELHLLFKYRVLSIPKFPKSSQEVWDCIGIPLIKWACGKSKEQMSVSFLQPKWSVLSEQNAGLLLASHVFSYTQIKTLLQVHDSEHVIYKARTTASAIKHQRDAKAFINPSIHNRIRSAGFIHSGVQDMSWKAISLVSELIQHPGGISFIEYALSEALTAWEVNYDDYGAGAGFFYFSQKILQILPLIFMLQVRSETDETWDVTCTSLTDWMSRNNGETYDIELRAPQYFSDAKCMYVLARLLMTREDMGIWHVPLQGRNDSGFHWDGVSSWI